MATWYDRYNTTNFIMVRPDLDLTKVFCGRYFLLWKGSFPFLCTLLSTPKFQHHILCFNTRNALLQMKSPMEPTPFRKNFLINRPSSFQVRGLPSTPPGLRVARATPEHWSWCPGKSCGVKTKSPRKKKSFWSSFLPHYTKAFVFGG